jgi:hypothetical protein
MQGFEALVLGTREQFVFDWNTGRLISIETYVINEGYEETLSSSTTYLRVELISELPNEVEKPLGE